MDEYSSENLSQVSNLQRYPGSFDSHYSLIDKKLRVFFGKKKIVAGAAAAGRWKSHGRPLVERMEAVGVSPGDVRSWTALVLPLSRLGYADECLEVKIIIFVSIRFECFVIACRVQCSRCAKDVQIEHTQG